MIRCLLHAGPFDGAVVSLPNPPFGTIRVRLNRDGSYSVGAYDPSMHLPPHPPTYFLQNYEPYVGLFYYVHSSVRDSLPPLQLPEFMFRGSSR